MIIAGLIASIGPKMPVWIGWAAIGAAIFILVATRKWRKGK